MDLIRQMGTTDFLLGLGILITPLIPTNLLLLLDILPIRFILVLALLYAITRSPLQGLLSFFLIAILYLERNRRKVQIARYKFAEIVEASTPNQMTVEEEAIPQDTVPVREFEEPADRTMYYIPREGCAANSNEYTPIPKDESLNHKVVFPSVPEGAKAVSFYEERGFGRDSKNVL